MPVEFTAWFAERISHIAPVAPVKTPVSFLEVTGSPIKSADIIRTIRGVIVTITEASTGEVFPSPYIKTPWFNTTPKSEKTNINAKSRRSTLSDFTKIDDIQNKMAAPHILNKVNISPDIQLATKYFDIGM